MYCINLFHYDYCFNNRIIYIVMTEELVTLETAKLLKDKGFNWKCEHLIDRNKVITKYDLPQSMSCCTEIDDESVEFLCPVLYVAQKWLREIRGVYVYVEPVIGKRWKLLLEIYGRFVFVISMFQHNKATGWRTK